VPWDFAPPMDAEIFRFAAWDGGSSTADWLIPASGFGEELTDTPAEATSAFETYAVATPLAKASFDVHSAAELLGSFDSTLSTTEKIIQARCEDLFRGRKGTVYGSEIVSVTKLESAQKLEDQLRKGAIWVGDPPSSGGLRCALKEWPQNIAAEQAGDWASGWTVPVLPALATKLYQESSLREAPDRRNA